MMFARQHIVLVGFFLWDIVASSSLELKMLGILTSISVYLDTFNQIKHQDVSFYILISPLFYASV